MFICPLWYYFLVYVHLYMYIFKTSLKRLIFVLFFYFKNIITNIQ